MARHVPMPIPRELDLRRTTHATATSTTTYTTANIVVDRMNAVPGFLASAGEFLLLKILKESLLPEDFDLFAFLLNLRVLRKC